MSIEVIDMKKKTEVKTMKATVRMSYDVWSAARHAALDRGVSFGKLVEDALVTYLKVKP
jgi:predicted HicB family RNase H-like nuclease